MFGDSLIKLGASRKVSRVCQRAVVVFGLWYFFWLVFYFDFLKESFGFVAQLSDPIDRVLVLAGITGLVCILALLVATMTRPMADHSFVRGLVVSGVLLNLSSLVGIGLGSPLAWASLALAAAALFGVWRVRADLLVRFAFLCGVLGSSYALADQTLWAWSQWQGAEIANARSDPTHTAFEPAPMRSEPGKTDRHLPSVYIVVMEELSLSLVNTYANFLSLPNLSRLAREGVYFPRAYAVNDRTQGSIPSLFTGSYLEKMLFTAGRSSTAWLKEHRNLITDLEGLGYRIRVYNDFFDICSEKPCSPLKVEGASPVISARELILFGRDHFLRRLTFGLSPAQSIGGLLQGQPARVFYLEHVSNQPQFVYIHLFDPHYDYLRNRDGSFHKSPFNRFTNVLNRDAAAKVAGNYFEQILWADHLAGTLVDALLAIPADERIVVFLSDHGISWREAPFDRGTGFFHSTQVHVPVIVLAPHAAPRIDPQLLPLIDIYPTVVDLLNRSADQAVLASPEGIEGLSLFANQGKRQARIHYAYAVNCKYRLIKDKWVLEKSLSTDAGCTDRPVPAEELALTSGATWRAIDEAAEPRPLPAIDTDRVRFASVPPPIGPIDREIVFLIQEGYSGYNIVRYKGRYYGIRQGDGNFIYEKFRAGGYKDGVDGKSADEVRRAIAKIVAGNR